MKPTEENRTTILNIFNLIFKKFLQMKLRNQIILLLITSLLPIFLSILSASKHSSDQQGVITPQSIDTLIPNGFTLIPIEVQNSEALNSLLGQKGIVNLLAPPKEPGKPSRLVAQRVPILRAPLNPSQFAVLVPEKTSYHITREGGPFWVLIQNPSQTGMHFEQQKRNSVHARIIDGGVE